MGESSKPRVFLCMPSRGWCRVEAAAALFATPTLGAVEVMPGFASSSLLTHSFNLMFGMALNMNEAGAADYWALLHDDIQPAAPGWLDVLVGEARRTGAAALSAVQAIKDASGDTSTAICTGDPWKPRRLTLEECHALPETFSADDVPGYSGPLLINTGCLLVDLSRPEFHETADRGHGPELRFRFHMLDRVARQPDGQWGGQIQPEDWVFSRELHAAGLKACATTAVLCQHFGDRGHPNRPAAGAGNVVGAAS